jgi:hypothetical protein
MLKDPLKKLYDAGSAFLPASGEQFRLDGPIKIPRQSVATNLARFSRKRIHQTLTFVFISLVLAK